MGTSNVTEHSTTTHEQQAQQQINSAAVPAATTVATTENEVRETQLNKENTFHFALENVTYQIVRPHIDVVDKQHLDCTINIG